MVKDVFETVWKSTHTFVSDVCGRYEGNMWIYAETHCAEVEGEEKEALLGMLKTHMSTKTMM